MFANGTAAEWESDLTDFSAGSAIALTAKSVTCFCGNQDGQGGFIDLDSPTVAIAPFIVRVEVPYSVGQLVPFIVTAKPRGSETVEVHLSGAGVEQRFTLTEADFGGGNTSNKAMVTPTEAGSLHAVATLQPYGLSDSYDRPIGGTNSGAGGGSQMLGTGGGGGNEAQPMGCAAAPGSLLFGLLALLRRRRA